jgi:hypothetical protein
MGYERSALAVVPQASWESLFTANAPANHRCRDCAHYADPTATHSDCTIRGIRKAGYAGACKKRVPRGHGITSPDQHLCVDCGADISHKRRDALVCESCRKVRDGKKAAGHAGTVNPFKTFHINPSMGPKPVRTRKDMSMNSTAPDTWSCTPCHMSFATPQALGAHNRHHHPKIEHPVTVAVPKQVPVAATPTPTVLASVFTTPDAPEHAPQKKADTLPVNVIVTGVDAVRDLILDLRNELEEVRIENLVMALRDVLGDGMDAFMSAHLFPAIEAAEAAGEARAAR